MESDKASKFHNDFFEKIYPFKEAIKNSVIPIEGWSEEFFFDLFKNIKFHIQETVEDENDQEDLARWVMVAFREWFREKMTPVLDHLLHENERMKNFAMPGISLPSAVKAKMGQLEAERDTIENTVRNDYRKKIAKMAVASDAFMRIINDSENFFGMDEKNSQPFRITRMKVSAEEGISEIIPILAENIGLSTTEYCDICSIPKRLIKEEQDDA